MREIKFRAWEHNLKEMIEVDDIQFHRGDRIFEDGIELKPRGEQPIMINTRSAWRIADGQDVTLMQDTGLKDKNGVEIYEGDILQHENNSVSVVEWSKLDWGWFMRQIKNWSPKTQFDSSKDEVIGNLYENPELLINE
jgi:uncharacterized phage protein (TIGR01671 family)